MTSLFQARRKLERRHNIKLLASLIDWTVALYLVIPTAIISFFLYKDFAIHVQTLWVAQVPLVIIILLLFFVTRLSNIRTYLQRADRLFLIQNRQQMIRLKRAGLYWTVAKHICLLSILLALLTPIFIKVHHLTFLDILFYLLLLFTISFTNALLQLHIQHKWQQLLAQIVVWLIGTLLFLYTPSAITALICTCLLIYTFLLYERHFVRSIQHFEQQVELDQVAFYRWHSTIFQIAPELRSQLSPKIKKPRFLWKNSKRLFTRSDYCIEELICKTMLRHKQYKWGYLRFLWVGIGLILVVPTWAKFVLVAMLFFTLRTYMQSIVHQTFEHTIWTIFQVTNEQIQLARTRLINYASA